MVFNCVVFQCSNRQSTSDKENRCSFFRFPKDVRKRKAWVIAVNRADWAPNEYSRICSAHFVDGWHSDDPSDINYRPTLFSYKEKDLSVSELDRNVRLASRNLLQTVKEQKLKVQETETACLTSSVMMHSSYATAGPDVEMEELQEPPVYNQLDKSLSDTSMLLTSNVGSQCDTDPLLKDNDQKTRFYTGLPKFVVFMWLFNYLKPKAERMQYWTGSETYQKQDRQRASTNCIDLIDQFFAVLMRLRLGLFVRDIAERFKISESTFSKYFSSWLLLLYEELKVINPFPSREIVDRTMPDAFKTRYPKTRVIIDCTEIFLQRSASLVNQSLTYSNYKNHNTVKFLIGITPSGVISFVSEGWSGRVSDRQITLESGILDLLDENDSVMADKGFTIKDLLEKKNCTLNMPPFKGISAQFTTEQVFETQEIAKLRIHVERSIGRVKNFHIFDGVMPLSIAPQSTQIFKVCCWLTNFDEPLVK
ncbi:unnamed protein product [Mytilus edulis]|uniref:THAP-type domain-containing protein n=1 Tax=Mytilus edulis TaxID=6550 RepID=A0A8S3PZX7_MYTED|nr:unnamed protein product [Mytilus edulis]